MTGDRAPNQDARCLWSWSRPGLSILVAICGCNSFDAALLRQRPARPARAAAMDAGHTLQPMDASIAPPMDAGVASAMDATSTQPRGASSSTDGATANSDARTAGPSFDAAALDAGRDDDAGSETCRASVVDDCCLNLPALAAPPQIDGVLDCGPPLLSFAPSAWNGKSSLPPAHGASMAAAYRPDGLYVYVEVQGQPVATYPSGQAIYCGDAIELYVDGDGQPSSTGTYDSPGTMQFIIAAPATAGAALDAHRFSSGADQGAWRGNAIIVPRADGYALEAFITSADLGLATWSPSVQLGLDLAIDVSGSAGDPNLRCGLLLGQYFLRVGASSAGCSGDPWCDSRAFCTPAL